MRLIDADEFKLENKRLLHCDFPYLSEVTLEELIDDAPTVDAIPVVHGHWEMIWHIYFHQELPVCSHCRKFVFARFAYCPLCGALMDEVTE